MLVLVTLCVKDRQEDQPQSSGDGEDNGSNGTGFVEPAFVLEQLTGVSKPTLR